MLTSMTGYGRSEGSIGGKKIMVEIRSLNSKQADIFTRLPLAYRQKEIDFRSLLQEKLHRGKIEISVQLDESALQKSVPINKNIVAAYYSQMEQVARNLNVKLNPQTLLETIMRFPDVFQSDVIESVAAEEWSLLFELLSAACDNLIEFRTQEGASLQKDILLRIENIEAMLARIEPFETKRIETIKARIAQSLSEISNSTKIDNDRFEQELIFYLEKLDITEEKVRLSNHCKYFVEVAASNDSQNGRKLNFISQEIGREINTIGSKASNAEIQQIVVNMKDELEKVKEQLLNVL